MGKDFEKKPKSNRVNSFFRTDDFGKNTARKAGIAIIIALLVLNFVTLFVGAKSTLKDTQQKLNFFSNVSVGVTENKFKVFERYSRPIEDSVDKIFSSKTSTALCRSRVVKGKKISENAYNIEEIIMADIMSTLKGNKI